MEKPRSKKNKFEQPNSSPETIFPPEVLQMYEISGQDKITQRSVERYREDKRSLDEAILIRTDDDLVVLKHKMQHILDIPEDQRYALLRRALDADNLEMQLEAVSNFEFTPPEQLVELIKIAFTKSSIEVQSHAAPKIMFVVNDNQGEVLENMVFELEKKGLRDANINTRAEAARMTSYIPEEKISEVIRNILMEQTLPVKLEVVLSIYSVQENQRADLLELALNDTAVELQETASKIISAAPENEKERLRKIVFENAKKALQTDNLETEKAALRMARDLPEKEGVDLAIQALRKNNLDLQKAVVGVLPAFHPDQKIKILQEVFKIDNLELLSQASEIIPRDEKGDTLRSAVYKLINKYLSSNDISSQRLVVPLIRFAQEKDRFELICGALDKEDMIVQKLAAQEARSATPDRMADLIKRILENENPEIQIIAARLLQQVPSGSRPKLFELVLDRLGDNLIEPALYQNDQVKKIKFGRAKLEKDGSETTLIGGSLHGKTIVRHLELEPFLAWQKLYENAELWRENNFDYVPIEPIQSFRLNKEGLVDVYSGVLDISLGVWSGITTKFVEELELERRRIIIILHKINFSHGHSHEYNFCLRFWRDENGMVDFTKKPRIYLIDFDEAVADGDTVI